MTSEGIMILFILAVILLGVSLFYKDRKVSVIVIKNLPPWIFKKDEREDYSKNCELKSVNEDYDTEDITEEHINTQEKMINEEVKSQKDKEILKEKVPVIKDIEQDVNLDENIENNSIKEDLPKDSENIQSESHKPKFITNSMSMLKDYEKLVGRLEENSISEEKGSSVIKSSIEKVTEGSEFVQKKAPKKVETVYWTNSGRTYHRKRSCTALARSKIIHRGTIEESKKLVACSKCK